MKKYICAIKLVLLLLLSITKASYAADYSRSFSSGLDTFIWEDNGDAVMDSSYYGYHHKLKIGGNFGKVAATLVKFNIAYDQSTDSNALTPASTILSAAITFVPSLPYTGMPMVGSQFTKTWEPTTATWNNLGAFSVFNYIVPQTTKQLILNNTTGRYEMDAKALLQQWLVAPSLNKGVIFFNPYGSTDEQELMSSATLKFTYRNPTPPNVLLKVSPTADTYIDEGNCFSSFGNVNPINFSANPFTNKRALVKFSLPTLPPGAQILNVNLSLYSQGAVDPSEVRRVNSNVFWNEASTWCSFMGSTTVGLGIDVTSKVSNTVSDSEPRRTGTVNDPTFFNYNVTSDVINMYQSGAAQTNTGWLIKESGTNSSIYAGNFLSREYGIVDFRPTLDIIYKPQ